jgi:mycothiol synthase
MSGEDRIVIGSVHEPPARELRGLAELIDRTSQHDGHRPIGEHALIELKQGPRLFPHAAIAARIGGVLVGYAHLSQRASPGDYRLEAFTAPEQRGRGIGRALIEAAVRHVASHGGGRIRAWAYHPGLPQERLAARFEMRRERTLLRMTRSLPGPVRPLPRGVTVRPFGSGDAAAWLELHNAAFALHPDAGGWREVDLAWHREEPWFDPQGLLLASGGRGLVGYCWMKLEGHVAWVYFLGVHPDARRAGLGAALCTAGLGWAHRRRARLAHLYVDHDNVAAAGLYRRLGFATDHVDVSYRLEVPASVGLGERGGRTDRVRGGLEIRG